MSKIVKVANAMIMSDKKITDVQGNENGEYFFMYDGKYKWSINCVGNEYNLFYYPGDISIEKLMSFSPPEWDEYKDMIRYGTKEINAKEARDTFRELYLMLKEKAYGTDKAFDDIIENSEPPF